MAKKSVWDFSLDDITIAGIKLHAKLGPVGSNSIELTRINDSDTIVKYLNYGMSFFTKEEYDKINKALNGLVGVSPNWISHYEGDFDDDETPTEYNQCKVMFDDIGHILSTYLSMAGEGLNI